MTGHAASLRFSLWDAFFFSLMVGIGETYLPAYALSVGMSEWVAGLFATAPLMSGALIQLFSPWMLVRVGSIKKWVVGSAFVQALSFVPLIYFCFQTTQNIFWIFFFATLYWGAGFSAGPAWNYWMGQLVPESNASQFFAQRHRIMQVGILLGLVGGGLLLHRKVTLTPFVSVFGVLFLVAFISRTLSTSFLSLKKQSSPDPGMLDMREIFSFWKNPAYRSFFGFLFFFYVTIFVSSPFVTPYFIEKLHLDYRQYMLALASLFLAKIAVLPWGSSLMRKYGVKRVFFVGAIGISPLPALWGLSDQLWFVMGLQAVSGFFWGLFEVSLSVTFFNQIKPQQKILMLTAYNLFNSIAVICGSLIGGEVLKYFDASRQSYYGIFILGAFLRCLICGWYAWKVRGKADLILPENELSRDPSAFADTVPKRLKAV